MCFGSKTKDLDLLIDSPSRVWVYFETFFFFWSQDLVQKLRAEILRILAAVARAELNSEAHFWPKTY